MINFPLYTLFSQVGMKLKGLVDAAENYHSVLAENRKLYNEVQDLKGTLYNLVLFGFCCQVADAFLILCREY